MFTLTESAAKELQAFFDGKEKSPVRVYLAAGGCSGPRLALALDESRDGDEVFSDQGFEFCISKELYDQAKGITVDAGHMGFMVESEVPFASAGGCSGCSGGCSC